MKRPPRYFLLILMIFFVFPPFSAGADETDHFYGRTIQKIILASTEGDIFEELKKQLPVHEGDPLSVQKIKESIQVLYKIGEFSNILVSAKEDPAGITLQFTLIKKLRIGAIRIKGNRSFSNKRVEEALKLKIDDELVKGWEDRAEKALALFYRQEGFFNTRIKILPHPFEIPSRLSIDFYIDEGNQSTLGDIHFTGDTGLREKVLLDALRIHSGFYYSKNSIQTYINELLPLYSRKRYLKAKFNDPILHPHSPDRVDLEIPVQAGPQIFVYISLEGTRHYLNSTLLKQIIIDEEKGVDDSILDESVKRLIEFYQNEGYPFIDVKAKSEALANGKILNVFFQITEGPRVVLKDVNFRGNSLLPESVLRESISHQKTGIWVPNYIRISSIQSDVQALVELYRSHGFLFTEIKENTLIFQDKKRGIMEFEISEGVRTVVQNVQLDGFSESFLPDIQKILKTEKGGYYYTGTILQDKIAITSYYHKKGYPDASIEATAAFNENKDLADIRFQMDEGSLIKVGHIQLTGNEVTHPNVILREVDFKTGENYQEDIILKSQRKIARLGYFQSVRILPINPDEEVVDRDIEIQVKERNAGALEFGAGYADVERINGFAELSHKNIAGTGRRASIRTEISQIGNKESIGYTEPWIFNLPLDARSVIYYEYKYNPNVNYISSTVSGSIGVEKSVWENYKLSLYYQNENIRYIDVPLNAQLAPEDSRGESHISSINPSVIRDTRDDFLNPKQGSFNAFWLRWAAQFMGSQTQEVKLSLQSSWFYPVADRTILAVSSRAGIAYNFGDTVTVPISERFVMGGRSTVRGYPENMLGTVGQTIDPITLSPVGGESMVLFNLEVRHNFPNSLGFVLFFDSGNVWENYNTAWSSPLKSSIGPGLRYNTPVGPLRIDLGFKLNKEAGESDSEFHFTLGHAF